MSNPEEITVNDAVYVLKNSTKAPLDRYISHIDFTPILGEQYVIETPTKYWVGTLYQETETDFIFIEAAWVANTGKFADCFSGSFKEMEPLPGDFPLWVAKGAKCVMYPFETKIQLIR